MPFIGTTPTQGFVSAVNKQSFTPNGSTTVFTLSHSVSNANDLEVFVGNVRQEPTAAYSASGTTLTMTEAVAANLNFYVIFKNKAQVTTTPPDNSVGTAKITNNAVTVGKIATSGTLPALNGSSLTHTGGLKSVQVFTSSGTYTTPAGIRTVKVIVTGGGGQGGGYGAANDYGGGGGAGGTAIETIDVSGVSTVTVNVGAGGAGGASGSNDGAGGAGSSFGSFCTGNGGGGGRHGNYGAVQGGQGGSATGGDINLSGGMGDNGVDNDYVPGGVNYRSARSGGASFWGGGGRGGAHNQGASAGMAYGSGGGGGSGSNSGAGGAGQGGVVYVEEYA